MSSFRRNHSTKSASNRPPGFHPSHYNGVPTASTGIASLDDVLGGGLPLSSVFVIDEDLDGSYAKLVLRYWIAQGIASRQRVLVLGSSLDEGGDPSRVIERLMSLDETDEAFPDPASSSPNPSPVDRETTRDDQATGSDEDEIANEPNNKHMKIAWRYEALGKHQAEAEASERRARCHSFDLSKTMQISPEQRSRIHSIDSAGFADLTGVLSEIKTVIKTQVEQDLSAGVSSSFRVAIQSLGSAGWPPCSPVAIYRFVNELKATMRTLAPAVGMLTFPSACHPHQLGRMLPWAAQGYMSLESFAGNERTQAAFPNHQGAVNFIRLPCPASLSPPATKLSVLRGLGGTSSEARIDSNLGFRLGRRKGFRIEMMGLGLDLETEPTPEAPSKPDQTVALGTPSVDNTTKPKKKVSKTASRVRFGDPGAEHTTSHHPVKNLGNTDW